MLANIFTSASQLLAVQLGTGAQQVTGALLMLALCTVIYLIGWHRRQRAANKLGMASLPFIATCLVIALIAVGGAAYGLGMRASFPTENKPSASSNPTAIPKATNGSVLLASRFYSAKNKEEVADRLDKISDSINKANEEILVPTRQVLIQRYFARPADAESYLKQMDDIRSAAKSMDALLYDDIIAKERDYRVEMNAILFPKEPLIAFMLTVPARRSPAPTLRHRDDIGHFHKTCR